MSRRIEGLRRGRTAIEEVDAEGSWAISYGDMVTLLLTFFILFFNVNQKTAEQQQKVQNAVLVQLGAKATDRGEDRGKEEPMLDSGEVVGKSGIEESTLRTWGGQAHPIGNRILIEFPEISFYKLSSIKLTPEAQEALNRFTTRYMPYAGKNVLSVKAFTDNVAVDKERSIREGRKFEDNLELSALRAISAMRALQKSGIPLDRMRIAGHGELNVELRKIASDAPPSSKEVIRGNPMARKIVLVIEPETKERL